MKQELEKRLINFPIPLDGPDEHFDPLEEAHIQRLRERKIRESEAQKQAQKSQKVA